MRDPHNPYGTLTPIQVRLTRVIHQADNWADTSAIADAVGVGVSHANRMLNILLEEGVIARRPSPRVNRGKRAHQWRCTH